MHLMADGWPLHGAQVHCAVEHALLLRCTLDETARSLEAAGVAPAIFTRLGKPSTVNDCTAAAFAFPGPAPVMLFLSHMLSMWTFCRSSTPFCNLQCGSSWRSRTHPSFRSTTKHSQRRYWMRPLSVLEGALQCVHVGRQYRVKLTMQVSYAAEAATALHSGCCTSGIAWRLADTG